jgi:Protein of unknown function (DUF1524)
MKTVGSGKRPKLSACVLVVAALIIAGTVAGCYREVESPTGSAATQGPVPQATAPPTQSPTPRATAAPTPSSTATVTPDRGSALALLATLAVKGRAPRTGYSREVFGQAWADTDRNGCDTRNDILRRDLTGKVIKPDTNGCLVLSGTLADPYTARIITFHRGEDSEVDIDHVVSLSDAWQTGAFAWPNGKRLAFANDPH